MPKPIPFTLRSVEESDAEQILSIYLPYVDNSGVSFEETVPTLHDMRQRIRSLARVFPWLVAVDSEQRVIGYAYASRHRERLAYRWAVEVSVYVQRGQHGQGIASRLYKELFQILGSLNLYRAFAGITLPNDASVTFHEGLGFKCVGIYKNVGFKAGAWRDVGWWELTLRELETPPAQPLAVSEIELAPFN